MILSFPSSATISTQTLPTYYLPSFSHVIIMKIGNGGSGGGFRLCCSFLNMLLTTFFLVAQLE